MAGFIKKLLFGDKAEEGLASPPASSSSARTVAQSHSRNNLNESPTEGSNTLVKPDEQVTQEICKSLSLDLQSEVSRGVSQRDTTKHNNVASASSAKPEVSFASNSSVTFDITNTSVNFENLNLTITGDFSNSCNNTMDWNRSDSFYSSDSVIDSERNKSLSPPVQPKTPSDIDDYSLTNNPLVSHCVYQRNEPQPSPMTSSDVNSSQPSTGEHSSCKRQIFSTFTNPEKEYGYCSKEVYSEQDLEIKDTDIPTHLADEQFDAVLLYCEKDEREAMLFKDVIEKFIILEDGKNAKISTLDKTLYLQHIGSKFKHLEEAVKRSTYMFLFMSENFVKDAWAELMKDEVLQESIENPAKKWCVVPVHPKPKAECTYDIPWGLRSLKGHFIDSVLKKVRYQGFRKINIDMVQKSDVDPFFLKSMTKMLNVRLNTRLERQDAQKEAREIWMNEEKARRKDLLERKRMEQELQQKRNEKQQELKKKQLEEEKQKREQEINAMTSYSSDMPKTDSGMNDFVRRSDNVDHLQLAGLSQTGVKPNIFMEYYNFFRQSTTHDEAFKSAKEMASLQPHNKSTEVFQAQNQLTAVPGSTASIIINNPHTVAVGDSVTVSNTTSSQKHNDDQLSEEFEIIRNIQHQERDEEEDSDTETIPRTS